MIVQGEVPHVTDQPDARIETWIDTGPDANAMARRVSLPSRLFHAAVDVDLNPHGTGHPAVRVVATPNSVVKALRRCDYDVPLEVRQEGPQRLSVRWLDGTLTAARPPIPMTAMTLPDQV